MGFAKVGGHATNLGLLEKRVHRVDCMLGVYRVNCKLLKCPMSLPQGGVAGVISLTFLNYFNGLISKAWNKISFLLLIILQLYGVISWVVFFLVV